MLKHSARCVLIRSHRHCITYSAYRRGEVMPKSGFMWKALIHFPPLKKKKEACSHFTAQNDIDHDSTKHTSEVSPVLPPGPPRCHAFYGTALHRMSKFMLEWTPKRTMCICARDKVFSLYVLLQTYSAGCSLSLSPWCVFHVCWKDKHSCTLMTLKCFWDSEWDVCVRVCMHECLFFFTTWE